MFSLFFDGIFARYSKFSNINKCPNFQINHSTFSPHILHGGMWWNLFLLTVIVEIYFLIYSNLLLNWFIFFLSHFLLKIFWFSLFWLCAVFQAAFSFSIWNLTILQIKLFIPEQFLIQLPKIGDSFMKFIIEIRTFFQNISAHFIAIYFLCSFLILSFEG